MAMLTETKTTRTSSEQVVELKHLRRAIRPRVLYECCLLRLAVAGLSERGPMRLDESIPP